jgi:hypothetical protein
VREMSNKNKLPVVLCEVIEPKQPGQVPLWRFWCPFCKVYHQHSAGPGHRVAHCADESSPFFGGGYILKLDRT